MANGNARLFEPLTHQGNAATQTARAARAPTFERAGRGRPKAAAGAGALEGNLGASGLPCSHWRGRDIQESQPQPAPETPRTDYRQGRILSPAPIAAGGTYVAASSTTEIIVAIVGGVAVVGIVGVLGYASKAVSRRRGRGWVTIELRLSDAVAALPFRFSLLLVREGPDAAPLLNRGLTFTIAAHALRRLRVSYPLNSGLQFKCFADWTNRGVECPQLPEVVQLFEESGWCDITQDGLHHGRFWFILPEYATKDTSDANPYTNNWLPAGPKPS